MAVNKDEGIVLRRLDYSETSQVLVVLTRQHGLQRLIAKGVKRGTRKRFATGIDLLERGTVAFLPRTKAEGTLGTLTEWRQLELHLGVRSDLGRWYAGQYMVEVTAAMLEDADPHPLLFDALAELLGMLAVSQEPLPLLCSYQRALLMEAGLWPDLTRCVICGRVAPPGRAAWYSAHQGGLVCRNCEAGLVEKRQIPSALVTALRERRFDSGSAAGVFDVLDYTIGHVIGRLPALSQFIKAGRGGSKRER